MTYGYSSGWCERCGRRRGNDGRCANCDPWYTSPLVQVGVPVLAAAAAGLVLVVATFGPRPSLTPTAASAPTVRRATPASPGMLTPPPVAWNQTMPSAPLGGGFSSAPFAPSTTIGASWTPLPTLPSPETQKWNELEQLRSLVWSAASAERSSSDSGRWSGGRPDIGFGETN